MVEKLQLVSSAPPRELVQDLAEAMGLPRPSPDHYWKLKRAGASLPEILEQIGAEEHIDDFSARYRERVEAREYLAIDRLISCLEGRQFDDMQDTYLNCSQGQSQQHVSGCRRIGRTIGRKQNFF